jgi:hypothetical protein
MCDDIVFGATGAEQPFVTNDGGITAAVQGNIASTSTAPVGVSITLTVAISAPSMRTMERPYVF